MSQESPHRSPKQNKQAAAPTTTAVANQAPQDQANVNSWSLEDVFNWVRSHKDIRTDAADVLKQQRIDGVALALLDRQVLKDHGILAGDALKIVKRRDDLIKQISVGNKRKFDGDDDADADDIRAKRKRAEQEEEEAASPPVTFDALVSEFVKEFNRLYSTSSSAGPIGTRNILGPFFKKDLPTLDKGAQAEMLLFGDPVRADHAPKDVFTKGKFYCKLFLGISGCGKTRTLYDVARNGFVVLIRCTEWETISSSDPAYRSMINEINELELQDDFTTKSKKKPRMVIQKRLRDNITKATKIIRLNIIARLMALHILLKCKPNATPSDFLIFQLNGGQSFIHSIFVELKIRHFDSSKILKDCESAICEQLSTLTNKKQTSIIFAIDEVGVAHNQFLGCFASPKNKNKNKRGLLIPLLACLVDRNIPILLAGTSWSLDGQSTIASDIGKPDEVNVDTSYQMLSVEEAKEYISSAINISDCKISLESWQKLEGRYRLSAQVIEKLYLTMKARADAGKDTNLADKAKILQAAIDESYNAHKTKLKTRIDDFYIYEKEKNKPLLRTVYVACRAFGGVTSMKATDKFNPVDIGFASIISNDQTRKQILCRVNERLALDAITEWYEENFASETIAKFFVNNLKNAIETHGIASSTKGFAYETLSAELVRRLLSGKSVKQVLKQLSLSLDEKPLPSWADEKIDVSHIAGAATLDLESDVEFLKRAFKGDKKVQNVLFQPEKAMRPDFLLLQFDKQTKTYWTVTVGCKMYTSKLSLDESKGESTSTDWRAIYLSKSGNPYNATQNKLAAVEEIKEGWTYLGGLQIHMILPEASESELKTEILEYTNRTDKKVSNDVVVVFDKNNFHTLFEQHEQKYAEEILEAVGCKPEVTQTATGRKCGLCRKPDHNRRNCPQKKK